MKKILFFAIIMTCWSAMAFAQKGLLTGQVTDMQKLSMPGAVLRLEPGNLHTVSDTYGKFQFLNVPVGDFTLTVTYIGYNNFTSKLSISQGKVISLNVLMEEATITGKEVVVMGDPAPRAGKSTERSEKQTKHLKHCLSRPGGSLS